MMFSDRLRANDFWYNITASRRGARKGEAASSAFTVDLRPSGSHTTGELAPALNGRCLGARFIFENGLANCGQAAGARLNCWVGSGDSRPTPPR